MNPIRELQRREPRPIAGRLPPHNLDAEAAVLSSVLLKPQCIDDLRGSIEPEHFYSRANGEIFQSALELTKIGSPIDLVTVSNWLRERERLASIGGTAYMAELIDKTPAIANVMAHAEIVVRKARMREISSEAHAIVAESYGDVGDEDTWIAETERRLHAIVERGCVAKSESEHLIEPTRRVFNRYLATTARPKEELVTTGFYDLDSLLALEPGRLVVIGARSGRGKSSLSTQLAMHVGKHWGNALYFSSEMPSEELALRAACMLAKVDSRRVRRGMCTEDEGHRLIDATNVIRETCAFMVDKAGLDILAIRATCRREVKRLERRTGRRVRAIVIDYLQRIKAGKAAPAKANREQEVAAIAFEAKELAMELRTCVIVPAQLNADGDGRHDERPRVSDLRESKNIENEADDVLLIHNPHYLARVEDENADLSVPEACEIIKGKGRQDGNGLVRLWFTPRWSRFDSMSDSDKHEERERAHRAKEYGRRRR